MKTRHKYPHLVTTFQRTASRRRHFCYFVTKPPQQPTTMAFAYPNSFARFAGSNTLEKIITESTRYADKVEPVLVDKCTANPVPVNVNPFDIPINAPKTVQTFSVSMSGEDFTQLLENEKVRNAELDRLRQEMARARQAHLEWDHSYDHVKKQSSRHTRKEKLHKRTAY